MCIRDRYDICPTNIVFELTEKVATKDIEALKESVSHYGKQGYETALDDMGAGDSGLKRCIRDRFIGKLVWIYILYHYYTPPLKI